MNLYDSIAQRKSCRKYDLAPLPAEMLVKIDAAIQEFTPLYPDVPLTWRFVKKVTGRFHVEAPHYLIVSGSGKAGEMESAGFLFEQLALWLDAMGLGCIWLGASKDAELGALPDDLIVLGFGKTTKPVHRSLAEFKRKPFEKITNAPQNPCLQAVQLAPSGMNLQPWYFAQEGERVLVYRQKLKPHLSLLYKLTELDIGIALCHYALACKELGKPFHFSRSETLPELAGYFPFGVID